jgi:SAM-dependent methyltransferase
MFRLPIGVTDARTRHTMTATSRAGRPWQLEMFELSLKKRQKVRMLLELLGPLDRQRCLLITHGDNPGSLNYHLRAAGGEWTWADLDDAGIQQMEDLLGEPVHSASIDNMPFTDGSFDRVVAVDVHEHVADVMPLNRELARITGQGGMMVVTTPGGNRRLPVAVLKRWVGMDETAYGHTVQGYRTEELEDMLRGVGLEPEAHGAYSRFFTELVELAINFAYVKVLGKRGGGAGPAAGEIAPRSARDLESVGGAYRAYRKVFPLIRAFSSLDRLIPGRGGYAVGVVGVKRGDRGAPL